MNEFDFIHSYLQHQRNDQQLILGIGDDAAIIRPRIGFDLHFSSDMLLAGKHFFTDVAPADLAHKILAVNLSDMAAMGATPRWALLSMALPELNDKWLQPFCHSLFTMADHFGVTLIGGDTTRGNWVFNITIIGETQQGKGLKRNAAQIGDDIWVSGQLGLAAAALNIHEKKVILPEPVKQICEQKLLRPEPRIALGQQLLSVAHAAQDISDGLAQDLGHILAASKVGAQINVNEVPTLPALSQWAKHSIKNQELLLNWMMAGGDDYELLFTAAPTQRTTILAIGKQTDISLKRIGIITDDQQLSLHDCDNNHIILEQKGFDHFS